MYMEKEKQKHVRTHNSALTVYRIYPETGDYGVWDNSKLQIIN